MTCGFCSYGKESDVYSVEGREGELDVSVICCDSDRLGFFVGVLTIVDSNIRACAKTGPDSLEVVSKLIAAEGGEWN